MHGAYNDVSILLGGQDELREAGLHCALVLVEHLQHVPAPLCDVPPHPPRQPRVVVHIHEDHQVVQIPQLCALQIVMSVHAN